MILYFIPVENFWAVYSKPYGQELTVSMVGEKDYKEIEREVRKRNVCVYFPK